VNEIVTLALRAVRHPQTGLAAVLSAASADLHGRIGAIYLAPAGPGPVELVAAAGRDIDRIGSPGAVHGRTSEVVRVLVLQTTAEWGPTPTGQPEPWSSYPYQGRVSTPLPSGGACLLLIAGEAPNDPELLREVSAPIALLAGALASARELEALRSELHAVRQSKTLMAAGLQHDLRAPLTSILGCARTLRTQGQLLSEEERAELLDIVASQSERMNGMVSEALSSDPIAEDSPLRRSAVSTQEVAARAAAAARVGRGGDVDIQVADDRLVTDSNRLERVLLNLLDNALKYSPEGNPVHLLGSWRDDEYVFVVADAGPGVTPSVVPTLFSAYATDPHRSGGIGLGLHSVATLARDLGGRVAYARKEGWTRFCVTIPDMARDAAPIGAEEVPA